jgi:hypothetical protein
MGAIKKFSPSDKEAVRGGSLMITGTDEYTDLVVLSICASGATVLDTCTGFDAEGNAYDFMDEDGWGTMSDKDTLIVPDNHYITNIKLASGVLVAGRGEK